MITTSSYVKYLNQMDLITTCSHNAHIRINQIAISFSYSRLLKHIFYYYNKLFSANTIYMNIYLFFFIVFNQNIYVVEKINKYKQKESDSKVSLKIYLKNTYKQSSINKFLFEFLFCTNFLKLKKKK